MHASPASGQKPGWHSTVEANATTLFGASSQTLTAATLGLSHVGEALSADVGLQFRYGESEDEGRTKFVSARGWSLTVSVDRKPKGRFSGFFSGTAEASLEKRIASRRSAGAGAKWLFTKSNTGSASASVSILGERTAALSDTAVAPTRIARWSWRMKIEQRIDDRLSLTHATLYGPAFNAPAQYTITTTSAAVYAITKAVGVTLTFTDNYESQARLRGAPTNNDGSLLFGIRGTF